MAELFKQIVCQGDDLGTKTREERMSWSRCISQAPLPTRPQVLELILAALLLPSKKRVAPWGGHHRVCQFKRYDTASGGREDPKASNLGERAIQDQAHPSIQEVKHLTVKFPSRIPTTPLV